jgi:hypothetical protein
VGIFAGGGMAHQPALQRSAPKLTSDQIEFLHRISRKTWKFFETFVGPEDNWLPPDNFQETPAPRITHRTSPTNIGLSLLANLAAFDFGYIGVDTLVERTANALETMEKAGAILRSFLQLVRHQDSPTLASALYFYRR